VASHREISNSCVSYQEICGLEAIAWHFVFAELARLSRAGLIDGRGAGRLLSHMA
jgi:hypothetical protein